jgi:hypothetical protein
MFIDTVNQGATATVGNTPTLSPDLDIGWDGTTNYSKFQLNEFRLYSSSLAGMQLSALIDEQNGVLMTANKAHEFNVGDIIGSDILETTEYFAVVTAIDSNVAYRIQPISDNLRGGMSWTRCGHLWDTDRQWMFIIDDTPQICFWDGQSLSSEVGTDAKKLYCLNTNGLVKNSSTKTANYTMVDTDQRIYVDSSGGTFTITLDATPVTDKEIEIIDSVGSCGTNAVTLDGNGNNIIGETTALMNLDEIGYRLIFNGTQWNFN